MKINVRFSMLGWLLPALIMIVIMSPAAQARSNSNSDHVYGYVDGVPDSVVLCPTCGPQRRFSLDDELLYKMISQSDNLAIRVTSRQSIQVANIIFEFTGPAGEQLGKVTQPIDPDAPKSQIFHLTKETVKALQEHVGKGNHLKVTLEMKARTGKDKIQLQVVTLSKVSRLNEDPFGAGGDSWSVSSRSSVPHPVFVPVSNLRSKESATRPSEAERQLEALRDSSAQFDGLRIQAAQTHNHSVKVLEDFFAAIEKERSFWDFKIIGKDGAITQGPLNKEGYAVLRTTVASQTALSFTGGAVCSDHTGCSLVGDFAGKCVYICKQVKH
jgi:hypothetical protein